MEKIGEGKTAEIYSDGRHAYKKLRSQYDIGYINYEVKIQNEIYNKTDLNVCHYEIEDDMIKMPLIGGVEFADLIRIEKYKKWLDDFTDLQCETYTYKDLDLPDAYKVFKDQIESSNLDHIYKLKALESLGKIDKTYHLCHLDFHPLNIKYDQNEYYILDWTNAKLANPAMDIASTYIIFKLYLKRQANKYLNIMVKKTGYQKKDIKDAIPLMAFVKLRKNDVLEHEQLLKDLIIEIQNI